MILQIVFIVTSSIISSLGIISTILIRENLGHWLNLLVNILLFSFSGIIFFSLFILSSERSVESELAFNLWRISLIFWVISLSILSFLQQFIIEFKKISVFNIFLYIFLGSIIMSLIYQPNAFLQVINDNSYIYIIQNPFLLILFCTFNFLIFGLMWYSVISKYKALRNKESRNTLFMFTSFFSTLIFIYTIFLFSQSIILKNIYVSLYLISAISALLSIITSPESYIEQTNKIFDFVIFHKSGILLYSYNFESGEETDEDSLKGTILIGINHILSNFINKKDQLNLIKMKNQDIFLEYDNKNGYAILLITNHKNSVIERALQRFMDKFNFVNKKILKNINDLSQLIDVSEFRNAKDILNEFFSPFILKKE